MFKFVHNIFVIQGTFLVFCNLLRGPDKTPSGAGSGPRAAGCASLIYMDEQGRSRENVSTGVVFRGLLLGVRLFYAFFGFITGMESPKGLNRETPEIAHIHAL